MQSTLASHWQSEPRVGGGGGRQGGGGGGGGGGGAAASQEDDGDEDGDRDDALASLRSEVLYLCKVAYVKMPT